MPKHIIKVHRSMSGQRRITLPADLVKAGDWVGTRYAIVSGESGRVLITPLSDKLLASDGEGQESEDGHE